MTTALTRDDVWKLPKTDLHRHVDGAVKAEQVFNLAKEFGIKLPTDNLEVFTNIYQITEPKNMPPEQLLERFAWSIAVMRRPEGIYEVFRQQVHDLAAENILYAELRFAPGYHSRYHAPWYSPATYETKPSPDMSLRQTVLYALAGLQQGMAETGVTVNLTLCIPRESLALWGPRGVDKIVSLALEFEGEGVTGLDLACDENAYPPDPYAQYFRRTIGSNIHRSPHAGEMGTNFQRLKNIAACVENFEPDGLGHAIPIWSSEKLMQLVREKNIRIERTPLSPMSGCSLADGHLDVLLQNKVPVVITSDDPVLMQASLTDNWMAALKFHDFGEKEFWQMTANAINTGFYRNAAQRKRVQREFVKQGLDPILLTR